MLSYCCLYGYGRGCAKLERERETNDLRTCTLRILINRVIKLKYRADSILGCTTFAVGRVRNFFFISVTCAGNQCRVCTLTLRRQEIFIMRETSRMRNSNRAGSYGVDVNRYKLQRVCELFECEYSRNCFNIDMYDMFMRLHRISEGFFNDFFFNVIYAWLEKCVISSNGTIPTRLKSHD